MRFEVPQFIEIEDKIFGPFTWRQFLYLAGGVGLGVVTFITLPTFVFVFTGLPVACLAALLAFYPVNNQPFSVFLESMLRFYNSNRIYHWRKNTNAVYENSDNISYQASPTAFSATPATDNVNALARQLELNALQKPE